MVRNSLPRLLVSSAIVLGLAGIGVSPAWAAVRDRIVEPATTGAHVAIPDTVQPRARLGTDLGPTAGNTKLSMSIRFNMTAEQEAALDQLLADQQNPASPRYHQWLTPEQFGAQFGLSSDDLATVSAWLTSQGFTVTGVANGGTFISFDGTVAQAQAAFATSIHNLSVSGETHFANVTNISVPSAFAGVVVAVTGLHNFKLQPRLHSSITPQFTSSVSGGHFVAPGDLSTIYNSTPLLNAGINGAGETIAVTGQVDIFPADIVAFRSASGLSTTNVPTTIHAYGDDPGPPECNSCTNEPNQGDLQESSLDLEWSGAMAPSATIVFVNGATALPDAMTYAIDNSVAPIVTTSYGLCEAGWGYAEVAALNALFKQGNAQGQTVVAPSADQGATDCDAGPYAMEGLAVDFPGSSPYVTSMGGTQFNGDAAATGSGSTWSATQYWAGTSGSDVISSALSYIPEAVWNDESSFDSYGGGGGGASNFFTKPTWQVGIGVPADGARDVPDLALDAADAHDPLLYCVNVAADGICTSGFRYASGVDAQDLNFAGGTSFDSQIFGGLLALIEQKNPPTNGLKGLGNINPTIYALANSKYYAAGQNTLTNSTVVFNDVTTGNNAMPCTTGTPNCGNGGTEGYNAGIGYDLASGWGSVNVANLANDWSLVTPQGVGTLGPDLSITSLAQPTPSSVVAGATVTLTASVAGYIVTMTNPISPTLAGTLTTVPGPTPTGTVQFLANNVALGSPVSFSSTSSSTATATYSWVTSCSALGQQVLSASYSGDTSYQGSIGPTLTAGGANPASNGSIITSPVEVQVTTSACPDFSLAPSGTGVTVSGSNGSLTVAAGGSIPAVTITATGVNNFAGTVTFSATAISSSGYAPTLTFSPTTITLPSATATTSLTLTGITAALHLPNAPGQGSPARHNSGNTPWYIGGSGVTIAALLVLVLPRRRRLGGLLLVVLAIALVGGASGCGGSSQTVVSGGGGGTGSNPYAGVYTVTVIGTYTSSNSQMTEHIATLTYNIN